MMASGISWHCLLFLSCMPSGRLLCEAVSGELLLYRWRNIVPMWRNLGLLTDGYPIRGNALARPCPPYHVGLLSACPWLVVIPIGLCIRWPISLVAAVSVALGGLPRWILSKSMTVTAGQGAIDCLFQSHR